MTNKKLIEVLKEYPGDAIVEVTWEGIFRDLSKKNIYRHEDGTLIIDADDNHYKKRIQEGEHYYSNNVSRKMNREHEIRR